MKRSSSKTGTEWLADLNALRFAAIFTVLMIAGAMALPNLSRIFLGAAFIMSGILAGQLMVHVRAIVTKEQKAEAKMTRFNL